MAHVLLLWRQMDFGKLFFRHLPEARRRKEMQSLRFVLVIAVLICFMVAGLIYVLNKQSHH